MRVFVLIAALGVLVPGRAAQAQTENKAAAEVAFRQGRALMAKGKTAQACEQFERSQKLDPQHGTQYNLGLCYTKLGRLASAWTEFNELAAVDTNARRKADSARRAKQLEPRLVRLLLHVSEKAPGMVIERSGVDVTAIVDLPTPTDPGSYEIVARAPGRATWKRSVALTVEGDTVTVAIPPLAEAPATDTGAGTATDTGASTATDTGTSTATDDRASGDAGDHGTHPVLTPTTPPPVPKKSSRRRLGMIVGGAGVAVTAAGLVMGGWAWKLDGDAADVCGGDVTQCDGDIGEARDIVSRARDWATQANIFTAAGLAVVAAGAVLYLTAPAPERAVAVQPVLGRKSIGLTVGGRF